MKLITFEDFKKVDIRAGTIIDAKIHLTAKKPAFQLRIDLGELGIKNSSAQITHFYTPESLIGKQVLCVVNFVPMRVGSFVSEVLTMGFVLPENSCIIAQPERTTPNGTKLL